MNFSYTDYFLLLKKMKNAGYRLLKFNDAGQHTETTAVIRHDIDISLEQAFLFASLEKSYDIKSTYFVMLGSQYYNALTIENQTYINKIKSMGHEIGLHFDFCNSDSFEQDVTLELGVLESIIKEPVRSVSWHKPVSHLLGKDVDFLKKRDIKNAYDEKFFSGCVYLSDSQMQWRVQPEDFIDPRKYPRIQLLTHPIWYSRNGKDDAKKILRRCQKEKSSKNVEYLEEIYPKFMV